MTRENLIEAIYASDNEWSCAMHEGKGCIRNCRKCVDNQLEQYEKAIYGRGYKEGVKEYKRLKKENEKLKEQLEKYPRREELKTLVDKYTERIIDTTICGCKRIIDVYKDGEDKVDAEEVKKAIDGLKESEKTDESI